MALAITGNAELERRKAAKRLRAGISATTLIRPMPYAAIALITGD